MPKIIYKPPVALQGKDFGTREKSQRAKKGVKKFGNMASLKDLNEAKGSMRGLLNLNLRGYYGDDYRVYFPDHLIANGHVKLMELLCHTDFDFNQCENNQHHPLIVACQEGCTEIVNLLVRSSKEFGIDLNARNDDGETGFMRACYYGQTEIVKLMINSSKEFGIDLNVRNVNGDTGFMLARVFGYRKIVKLMVNASREFNINIDA